MRPDDLYSVGERYRLIEQLGQGGMASVWVADDLEHGNKVAIKFLSAHYAASASFRARFEQEALALEQLQGPNIVQVHSHGVDQHGRPYIAMEFLDGEDLQTRLAREGRLSLAETAVLIAEIAKALHRAHAAGIVHRDLKPANVFFAREEGEELVKLVDFGIAKIKRDDSQAEATRTGTVFGTFNYMSPEQMRDSKDVDHRSDVWSLAVIAFRAVAGELPFAGQEYPELFPKICYDPIPRPSEAAPDLAFSTEVDAFFERALQRDRQHRFQTAMELAEELENVVHARPSIVAPKTMVLDAAAVSIVPLRPPEELSARGQPQDDHETALAEAPSEAKEAEQGASAASDSSDLPRQEQSTGGVTVPPKSGQHRAAAPRSASLAGRWASPLLGAVVGVVIAVVFMWRFRSAPGNPPPSPSSTLTMTTSKVSVTSEPTATSAATIDRAAVPVASAPSPLPNASPPPPSSPPPPTTIATAPPAAPPPTARLTAPATTAQPAPALTAPRHASRIRDSYCADLYPNKPYASSTKRSGCQKTATKYCCP